MVNAEMDSNDSRPTRNDKKRNLERSKIDGYTNDCSPHVPITPQKLGTRMEDPLTPTANLKMLVSAAFRMSHDSGQQKRELFNDNVVDNDDDDDDEYLEDSCSTISDLIDEKQDQLLANEKKPRNAVDTVSSGRKLKSLGLLCKKFLNKYPEGSEGTVINLHEVAKELNVERRRIYDIVNVLESLEYTTKKGKNTYTWHGSDRLLPTLRKLKALAEKIYDHSKEGSQDKENSEPIATASKKIPLIWQKNGIKLGDQEASSSKTSEDDDSQRRRNKSLGIFCQKLIMLFMVSKNHTIALDDAAKDVIEIDEDKMEKNNKTKVRRLYDIANILSSMGLIEKNPTYFGSRKAAFRWIGVDLDSLEPDTEAVDKTLNGESEFVPTKHSLFSQPTPVEFKRQDLSSLRKLESRSFSASNIYVKKRNKMPRTRSAATIINRKRQNNDAHVLENKCKINKSKEESDLVIVRDTKTSGLQQKEGLSRECTGLIEGSSDVICDKSGVKHATPATDSPIRQNWIANDEASPNERCFREEIRKLQKRFPKKMQDTSGLLHLLSAGNEIEKHEEEKRKRCNLLRRMEEKRDSSVLASRNVSIQSQNSELSDRNISISCFKAIVDQLKGKENLTLRHGIETAMADSFSAEDGGACNGVQNVATPKSKISQPWNCYPYHVSPTVEKTSIGVQASLLDDVSPLKPLSSINSPIGRKRAIEDSDLVTSQDVSRELGSNNANTPLKPLKAPMHSTNSIVSSSVSKCNTKPQRSYFLFGIKPSKKTGQNCDNAPVRVATSDVDKTCLTSSLQGVSKSDSVLTMVPIPPTRFAIGDDKENVQSSLALQGQCRSSVGSHARILLPLQVVKGESQRFAPPVLLPKAKEETTPCTFECSSKKAQRQLWNLPVSGK